MGSSGVGVELGRSPTGRGRQSRRRSRTGPFGWAVPLAKGPSLAALDNSSPTTSLLLLFRLVSSTSWKTAVSQGNDPQGHLPNSNRQTSAIEHSGLLELNYYAPRRTASVIDHDQVPRTLHMPPRSAVILRVRSSCVDKGTGPLQFVSIADPSQGDG